MTIINFQVEDKSHGLIALAKAICQLQKQRMPVIFCGDNVKHEHVMKYKERILIIKARKNCK